MPKISRRIAHVAIVVKDYDEAIRYYTEKLGFQVIEDTLLSDEKRWVLVAPRGARECSLLLAKAANDNQAASVGNQSGGRVFLFLHTENFQQDYENMLIKGVQFIRPPQVMEYGTVAVFTDLYGNMWDLIEPRAREA